MQDIDIPKLYFNRITDKNFEVIDGQQRLWAIWQYLDGLYKYKINGGGRLFSQLSPAQRKRIEDYEFQITIFEKATDEYLRKLFVRLQLGLLLNTGEKLNAAAGRMKQLVFQKLIAHPFIKRIGIPERRYARQTLCAQICINSFTRQKLRLFARTRYDDLLNFFSEYENPQGQDLTLFNSQSKRIFNILNDLWAYFGDESAKLTNRSFILSIYLFVEELGSLSDKERKKFVEFVFLLWKRLREEMKLGIDRTNRELYSFESFLSSAPGEAYQIERRHEKLKEYYAYFKDTSKIKGDVKVRGDR